ncbi:MAG: hypothetical protein QF829_02040 [Candidatus Hydrothermarchaeota archaeon]|nr:hypothetical protein [Candidatus Hydrothermarchaeota archaeon]
MTIASAYTLEDVVKLLDDTYSAFIDKEERYSEALGNTLEQLKDITRKYPEDNELKRYFMNFKAFNKKIPGLSRAEEKKELSALISDLKHKVHWRKLGMSSGKNLPYKDYRSLRGEVGRRGL